MRPIQNKYSYLHHLIFVHALLLIAVGLPFSEILLSFGQFILLINWIWENNFKEKRKILFSNIPVLTFLLLYIIHILWLINTHNLSFAFNDLKIKLPLLILPIIISTSKPLSHNELQKILNYFIFFVSIATFISFLFFLGLFDINTNDIRNISVFISHIRFSLMINLSIFLLSFFLIQRWYLYNITRRILILLLIVWLIFFLFILQSITGIIIISIFMPIFLFRFFLKVKNQVLRSISITLLIGSVILGIFFIVRIVNTFYNVEEVDFGNLPKVTKLGNKYQKFNNKFTIENGHYIWINICIPEIEKWWNNHSHIPFNGTDHKGQKLSNTLIRYMTSKGLKKDKKGCSKLSKKDIQNIENGLTNYIMANKISLHKIIYQIIWQIDVYKKTGECNNHSIVQRFEYWKTGIRILTRNFLLGVGTGDIQDEFNIDYQLNESKLSSTNRHRTHNQFLAFCITFGVIGFLIVMVALFFPVFKLWNKDFVFMIFFTIILLSFLNEDTLETQTGVTFFVFFYSIFLFGKKI